ncbi:MAG: hypothetical protein R2724_17970 [Bryobacterales bacterium]
MPLSTDDGLKDGPERAPKPVSGLGGDGVRRLGVETPDACALSELLEP